MTTGHTVSRGLIAALAAGSLAETDQAIADLLSAHMLQAAGPSRYQLHDLLCLYAAKLAKDIDEGERDSGYSRILHWYLYTADSATRILTPAREPAADAQFWSENGLPPESSWVTFEDFDQALQWFDYEHTNLVTAVESAAASPGARKAALAPRLVQAMFASVSVRAEYDPLWERLCRMAIETAVRLSDRSAEAAMRKTLGIVCLRGFKPQDAADQFERAYAIRISLGDTRRAGALSVGMACAYGELKQYDRAIASLEASLSNFRQANDLMRTGMVLNNLGSTCYTAGDYLAAVAYLSESVEIVVGHACRGALSRGAAC